MPAVQTVGLRYGPARQVVIRLSQARTTSAKLAHHRGDGKALACGELSDTVRAERRKIMMWPFPDEGSFPGDRRRSPATDDPDIRLTYRVAEALLSDDRVRHQRVAVEVQNSVVLLSGSVDSSSTKQAAGDTARGVTGVADICNTLRVTDDTEPRAVATGEFQRIVAEWGESDAPAGGRLVKARRSMVLWSILAAGTWIFLTLLMVTSQWTGVALTCVAIGLTLTVTNLRRRRRSGSVHPTRR